MTRRITLAAVLVLALLTNAIAQKGKSAGPKPLNMWEVGVNGGYFWYSGDVESDGGWAAGIHFRKSLDYAFSIRADLLYGMASGATGRIREYDSKWTSATVFGVLSMNNFSIDRRSRKFNYYVLVGAGFNRFETNFLNEGDGTPQMPNITRGTIMMDMAPHVTPGAGLAVRLSKRLNIGVEYQGMVLLGRRADLLDGTELEKGVRSPFRDVANYINMKVNFNLGNPSRKSEPLYWVSPGKVVFNEIDELRQRQDEAFKDSDKDGVIDLLDQEENTPPNAEVDTKGRTLDSDKDGVPNYRDKEPYYPPRAGETVDADGVVINPMGGPNGPGGGVTEERVREIVDEVLNSYNLTEGGSTVAEWFLPMIHFGTDSYSIKYSDYGNLAGIARMMKSNPKLRLVVEGHTDQTGDEAYNDMLSYERAKAVVDHMEKNHGISRGRFVIIWKGKQSGLVPKASSYMNRRVEFRAAGPNDFEMAPPTSAGRSNGY